MLKSKRVFIGVGFVSVITIILRTILIITNTDSRGLYIDKNLKLVLCLRVILIISTLLLFLIPFLDRFPDENRSRNNNSLLGMFMIIFGGVIMFVGLVEFFILIQLIGSDNFNEFKVLLTNTPNAIMKLLTSVIAFITGWNVTTLAIKIINNRPVYNNYFVGIMLVFWSLLRAMLFSKVNTTISNIDDNLYSMLTTIFSISFFFGVSNLMFDVDRKSGYRIAISSGSIVLLYGLLATIPNYIAFIFGKNTFFSLKDTDGITNIAVAVFAILFLCIILYTTGENSNLFEQKSNSEIEQIPAIAKE